MLATRAADRIGHDAGRDVPQPVEVRFDTAGRDRDREVAVEAGVRR